MSAYTYWVDVLPKLLRDARFRAELIDRLDQERGCVFQSSYEFPGRYARWTMGFVNPPLALEGWGRRFAITALNQRGSALLSAICLLFVALFVYLSEEPESSPMRSLDASSSPWRGTTHRRRCMRRCKLQTYTRGDSTWRDIEHTSVFEIH